MPEGWFIAYMKAGEGVRRPHWPEGEYIYSLYPYYNIYYGYKMSGFNVPLKEWKPTNIDLMANDWEVI